MIQIGSPTVFYCYYANFFQGHGNNLFDMNNFKYTIRFVMDENT